MYYWLFLTCFLNFFKKTRSDLKFEYTQNLQHMTFHHEGKSTSWLESGLLSVQECWPLTGSHNPWETRCSCVLNNPPDCTGASAGDILSIPINSVLYSYCPTHSTHSEINASRTHSYRHSYCLTYSTHAKTNASRTHRHTSTLTHTAASLTHTL